MTIGIGRSALAAILSFILPGAGLWFVGRRRLAAANFLIATAIVVASWMTARGAVADHIHYVILVVAAASAGLAHALAAEKPCDAAATQSGSELPPGTCREN
jgi:hypothetical protein